MISPRAVDSEGTIFFKRQNRSREDVNLENSDEYELHRVKSASPLSRNGVDRSADDLHRDMQPRIDRRTNTESDRSSGQEEQKPSEFLEIYKVLLSVAESVRDIREELRAIKRVQITESTNSTQCFSSALRNIQANCADTACISGGYFNNNNRTTSPDFENDGVVQRRMNLSRSTPNNQPPSSHFSDLSHIELPSFTGKEDWGVWIARFEAIACRFDLSSEDKLDILLPKLEGQAAQFVFSHLPIETISNYGVLIREISSRFRVIETPRSFAAKFSKRSQRIGETAEEFAADLQALYFKAHGYRDPKIRNEDLVRRFLDGLRDDQIRFEVEYHKETQTIDEAVFHVVNFIQTRNNRDRDRRSSENLRVTREETCTKSTALSAPPSDRSSLMKDTQTDETALIPTDGEDNVRIIKQLLDKVNLLEKDLQNGGTVRKQYVHVQCFACDQMGHYARDCPNAQSYHGNGASRGVANGNTRENPRPEVTGPISDVKHAGYLSRVQPQRCGYRHRLMRNPTGRVHGGTLTAQRLKPSARQLLAQPVFSTAACRGDIGRCRLQADRLLDQRKRSTKALIDKGLIKRRKEGPMAHKVDYGNGVQQQVMAELMRQN